MNFEKVDDGNLDVEEEKSFFLLQQRATPCMEINLDWELSKENFILFISRIARDVAETILIDICDLSNFLNEIKRGKKISHRSKVTTRIIYRKLKAVIYFPGNENFFLFDWLFKSFFIPKSLNDYAVACFGLIANDANVLMMELLNFKHAVT